MDKVLEYLEKSPLIAFCIFLIGVIKIGWDEIKRQQKIREERELKALETLIRVAEVVKENEQQSRRTQEMLIRVEQKLTK